jgi:hypothetical protein
VRRLDSGDPTDLEILRALAPRGDRAVVADALAPLLGLPAERVPLRLRSPVTLGYVDRLLRGEGPGRRPPVDGPRPGRAPAPHRAAVGVLGQRPGGAGSPVIARRSGHTSLAVLRRDIREGILFRESAAARVGW